MKDRFTLKAEGVALRAIEPRDLEDLRVWKNANKAGFFFKDEITPDMQKKWFEGYLAREHDYMFLVEAGAMRAGCMGFRMIQGAADAYNMIAAPEAKGKGIMAAGMRLMCSYIKNEHTAQIGCQVLQDNPAVDWYKKCGYKIVAPVKDYYQMELDLAQFTPCEYERA
jgi:ribosomal protein S18 acetylase RimI-like enzyme